MTGAFGGKARRGTSVLVALAVALGLAVVLGGAVAGAGTTVGDGLPLSPTFLDASAENDALQVKPATITYTGDGTGFLGGAEVRNRNSGIDWNRWTPASASGEGYNQLDNCNPSCAGGKYHGYPVRIEMWRPRKLAGNLMFTRMTIFYEKDHPRGGLRHYTFTDSYADGGYGWGPPGELDYCTHTHGVKPTPGCKNIHSLP
jgi:hypothetical protein